MKQSKIGLCILLVMSIIYGSMNFFSNLSMAVALPTINKIFSANPGLLPAEMNTLWERMSALPRSYFAVMGLLSALSVVGCILMWNLRRSGYHCYAIAQLLLILVPLLFLGKGYMGLGDVMFTALFLFIYYRMLKNLGAFAPQEENIQEEG